MGPTRAMPKQVPACPIEQAHAETMTHPRAQDQRLTALHHIKRSFARALASPLLNSSARLTQSRVVQSHSSSQ